MGAGIFVSHPQALSDASGGLQICTQEYVRTIRAAGIDLTFATIAHDGRITTRLLRRLRSQPYPAAVASGGGVRHRVVGSGSTRRLCSSTS
jgi:hypothetical protein